MTVIFFNLRVAMRLDRGVERGRGDPLVLRQQIVGQLVEIADPADHRRAGDEMIAVGQQFFQKFSVFRVTANELVAGIVLAGLPDIAVFREVIQPDDFVSALRAVLRSDIRR